ncbi:MAG: hypothetical protein JXJ04_17890 [Spirochaetales bacterium]|nr:hypothetical protein [Spirochaetales bacterium]
MKTCAQKRTGDPLSKRKQKIYNKRGMIEAKMSDVSTSSSSNCMNQW